MECQRNNTNAENSLQEIGFRNLYGEWVTENGTEFRISGGKGMCFITFHKSSTYGKKKGEIKYFVSHIGGGSFYFQMEKVFYDLLYIPVEDTIVLKACSFGKRKKYEPNLPRI